MHAAAVFRKRFVASLAWARNLSTVWRVSLKTRIPCNHSPSPRTTITKIPDPLGT